MLEVFSLCHFSDDRRSACVPHTVGAGLQGGDDIEAAVAMMINRERPNSVRIAPSQGDGGVDILDPRTPRGRDDDRLLQVKRFTAPLSANQKAQVLGSLDALVADPRWAKLQVEEWRLVTPWDPTPKAWSG
jgi:hypothetical protein